MSKDSAVHSRSRLHVSATHRYDTFDASKVSHATRRKRRMRHFRRVENVESVESVEFILLTHFFPSILLSTTPKPDELLEPHLFDILLVFGLLLTDIP